MGKILTGRLSSRLDKLSADRIRNTAMYKNCFNSIYNNTQSKVFRFQDLNLYHWQGLYE